MFSSMRAILVEPGIGTISSPRDSQPRERDLCGGAALAARQCLDAGDETKIAFEVVALKARVQSAPIVGGEIVDRADLSREQTAAQRTVGDEPDVQLATRVQQLAFGITRPEGIFGLQGGDRVDGVRASNRRRRRF